MTIGSRAKERAQATCDAIHERWPARDLRLEAGDNATAAGADVVVVATPWDAAAATVASVAHLLDGKVLISMANALARVGDEFEPLVPPRGSVASHVQAAAPAALVAAALHHLPAKELANLDHRVESDVLVCSDHAEATRITCELVKAIPGCRPLDTGTLSNATWSATGKRTICQCPPGRNGMRQLRASANASRRPRQYSDQARAQNAPYDARHRISRWQAAR